MSKDIPITYFNNCRNRDHVGIFTSGAFFDLNTKGRQVNQARDLPQGHICVVVEQGETPELLRFDWYSYSNEVPLTDGSDRKITYRVFFGRLLATELLSKSKAAHSQRYSHFFKITGYLKNGSVFQGSLSESALPTGLIGETAEGAIAGGRNATGQGFGDPEQNKVVEQAAIQAVTKLFTSDSWSVRSVERERCGYDLVCSKGKSVINVEVKGVSGTKECFMVTAREVKEARSNENFEIVVVTSALSGAPKLTRYTGPEFCRRFELSPIQYSASLRR